MKNHINASVEPQVIIKMDDCKPLAMGARFATVGDEIDRHQMIMRLDNAPTKGFEASVGRRTTHRWGPCTSLIQLTHTYLETAWFQPLNPISS
jgi:hypothetical protein